MVVAAILAAYAIARNGQLPIPVSELVTRIALPTVPVFLAVAAWRGLYRLRARYVGLYDFLNIAVISMVTAAPVAYLNTVVPGLRPSWSIPVLFMFLLGTVVVGSRIGLRLYSWRQIPFALIPKKDQRTRTIIVGAGDAGEMIIREIQKNANSPRVVNGLVDDDPTKRSLIIQGVRVLGSTSDIPHIVSTLGIQEIIIAVPSASGTEMRRLVEICKKTAVQVRTLPSVTRILTSPTAIGNQLRDVEIEDLLRREPARADMDRVAAYVRGESILITGGGGSIGGELARQIARLNPSNLVLFGKGENSLYEIEQEVVHSTHYEPSPFVGDVRNPKSLETAFSKYLPTIVFHAAAHKHVPLMQGNPIEAIENNVFGTLFTAEAAIRAGAKKFVYISTDKAVNPTSVMGATKRVGEMIVGALAQRSETGFAIVRFGNVLGSRGSLIPLLKSQIQRGGPVRVTHPDMTRYFMTIPEAVQLILHAGSSGSRGELFILDMGEPVRILDLAEDLIRLHGLQPHKDIDIKFIGIRPGEKIHEELVYNSEQLGATDHPKIQTATSRNLDWEWLKRELDTLRELCQKGEADRARQFLLELANGKTTLGVVNMAETTERTPLN